MGAETPPTATELAESVLLDPSQRGKLLAYARSRFGIGAEDAEDLLQDTLLELLLQRAQVRSPEGFVFTLFRLGCGRHVAASRASRQVFTPAAGASEPTPSTAVTEATDRRVTLRQALGGISSNCRRLLCAFYVEGRSLRETAATLALAQSGVSKTINRCLRRLRACLN
jgi:RNA polymerase sigma factor (sigma-70 family)